MARKLNVVIISAAWGVVAHLPAWRTLVDEVNVIGIMTSRRETAEAAAKANGIARAYWDIETLCADPDVDIVDVGTQPRIRQALTEKLLAAGKHCYVGLPFTTDIDWSRRLLDLQGQSGVQGVIDAPVVSVPAMVRMKEMIDEGAIGTPWFGHCSFNQQLFMQPPADWPYKWFAEPGAGASALRNLGSHALHAMTGILGPVAEVVGSSARHLDMWRFADGSTLPVDPTDTTTAIIRFASGPTLSFQTSWVAADGIGWALEIHGSGGRLLATAPAYPRADSTRLFHGPAGASYVPIATPVDLPDRLSSLPGTLLDPAYPDKAAVANRRKGPQDLAMARLMRALAQGVRDGTPADAPDFARAHHVQQVVEAIMRSQDSRHWEKVQD